MWTNQDSTDLFSLGDTKPTQQRSTSLGDLGTKCSRTDAMQEFRLSGFDSPYDPDEDTLRYKRDEFGLGRVRFHRLQSWPAEAPRSNHHQSRYFATSTPINDVPRFDPIPVPPQSESITLEQLRVLQSLPSAVLYSLLRDMEKSRDDRRKDKKTDEVCRFCKNNGERESYYRTHVVKDSLGRVTCPVLRAFVCQRCGATGDSAHTSKYCPLATAAERMKSTAMMRSVRMASGRRRHLTPQPEFVAFGDISPTITSPTITSPTVTSPTILQDNVYHPYWNWDSPLEPRWAALEQKLAQ